MFLVTTRDVETQQKGIVTVHVPEGIFKMSKTPSPLNTRSKQLRFLSYINGAYMSLPFKVCAHHLCLMHKGQRRFSTFERLTLKLVTGMVGECTHRLKIHMGKSNLWSTCLGCYYDLSIMMRANQNAKFLVMFFFLVAQLDSYRSFWSHNLILIEFVTKYEFISIYI